MNRTGPAPALRHNPRLRLVATGSRLVAGLAVAAALVLGAAAAIPAPLPEIRATAAQTVVTPDAGETALVCTGPFRALGRDSADALQMQAAGTPSLTVASDGAEPVRTDLTAADITGDTVVPLYTSDAGSGALIGAAQSLTLRDRDLSGLAAAPCRPASMQAWLVGGAASVGAGDVVTITNPSDVVSTVTMTTYGQAAPTTRTAVVPARTQIALPLAAAAVGESAPVVHIAADGAAVRAALQSSLVRTLDPGGVDLQDDAGAPALSQVLTGVQVFALGVGEVASSVRLMAPEADTEAQVTVRPAGATADVGEPLVVPLTAGTPIDIGFPGLAAGVYTITVTAGEPVVAAAWQAGGFHAGSDFAWMTPAPVIGGSTVVAVPRGAGARLHLVDAAGAGHEVELSDLSSGDSRTIAIDADGSALVSLRAGTSYVLSSDAAIRAAVVLSSRDALAGWPLWPEASRLQPLTVYP